MDKCMFSHHHFQINSMWQTFFFIPAIELNAKSFFDSIEIYCEWPKQICVSIQIGNLWKSDLIHNQHKHKHIRQGHTVRWWGGGDTLSKSDRIRNEELVTLMYVHENSYIYFVFLLFFYIVYVTVVRCCRFWNAYNKATNSYTYTCTWQSCSV